MCRKWLKCAMTLTDGVLYPCQTTVAKMWNWKFVDFRRQFEFSVDSFQIKLDSLLLFYECSENPMTETFHPTIIGEFYGDFHSL